MKELIMVEREFNISVKQSILINQTNMGDIHQLKLVIGTYPRRVTKMNNVDAMLLSILITLGVLMFALLLIKFKPNYVIVGEEE